jgi:hypothetical protein
MTVAIIGLAGALLGALTTLFGTILNDRRLARREDAQWRRDQRSAAYHGALRHLLRAANLRSGFTGSSGMAVVVQEHEREWFEDLIQAQFWLHQLVSYCAGPQLSRLQAAAAHLDLHVARLVTAENYERKGFSILAVLQDSIAAVEASTRGEYRENRPERNVHGQPESGSSAEPRFVRGNDDQVAVSPTDTTTSTPAGTAEGTTPRTMPVRNIPFTGRRVLLDKLGAALEPKTAQPWEDPLDAPGFLQGGGAPTVRSAVDFERGGGSVANSGGLTNILFLSRPHLRERARIEQEIVERQERIRAFLETKGRPEPAGTETGVPPKVQANEPSVRRDAGRGRRSSPRRKRGPR